MNFLLSLHRKYDTYNNETTECATPWIFSEQLFCKDFKRLINSFQSIINIFVRMSSGDEPCFIFGWRQIDPKVKNVPTWHV